MTIYRMTPVQADDWTLGGAAAAQVEQEILTDILDQDTVPWDVEVQTDDGSVAYALELGGVA
jgi:hypothetical protein